MTHIDAHNRLLFDFNYFLRNSLNHLNDNTANRIMNNYNFFKLILLNEFIEEVTGG